MAASLPSAPAISAWKPWSLEASKQRSALLTKLGRATDWAQVLDILADHVLHGPDLDVFACGASIRACEPSGQWEVVLAILDLGRASRVDLNDIAYNSAVSVCDKAKKWTQAELIVQDMEKYQVQTDVITWSSLVSAYAKGQQWEQALEALHSMPAMQLEPNKITYSAAISACACSTPWPLALEMLGTIERQSLETDAVVQTAAITACGFGANWEDCIHLATIMAGPGEGLRQITCNALMISLQRAGQWTQVLRVLAGIQSKAAPWQSCVLDSFSCAAAIGACGTGGYWQEALNLYATSLESVVLLNVVIVACGENFQWQWVLQLLHQSRANQLLPDTISCNSALTACQICGRWREAEAILKEMARQACCCNMLQLRF